MRTLKANDIFQKTYSIVNGEIIKSNKGDYYTKQVAEHVLNKSSIDDNEMKRIIKFDEEQLNESSVRYFRNKYSMLLSSTNNNRNLLFQPNKEFEIFTLDVFGGKVFLAEASSLPDGDNRDLYYNFEIANQVYQKTIDIKDSSFNDYEDVQYIYEREILKIENEISDLRIKDNEEFQKDSSVYDLISQTSLYENYQLLNRDKEKLIEENVNLKMKNYDYNEKIRDLSQKLMTSLERIDLLQRPKTFIEKIKYLFKNDKMEFLITDGKGDE